MAFTMPSFPILTPEQSSPFAQAMQSALKNYSDINKAKYQSRGLEADIFSKQFAPLAQIASNPVAMSMMGDQGAGVMKAIQQLLQQQSGGQGGQGGLLKHLFGGGQAQGQAQGAGGGDLSGGQAGGGAEPQAVPTPGVQPGQNFGAANQASDSEVAAQANAPQQDLNNYDDNHPTDATSNLPSAGGTPASGFIAKTFAPSQEASHAPGVTYAYKDKDGHIKYKSAASAAGISQAQLGMGSIQVALPLINKLQAEAKELMKPGRSLEYFKSIIAANLQDKVHVSDAQLKQLGISRDYYDKYEQFQKDQHNVAQRLKVAHNFGENVQGEEQAASIIAPSNFQSFKGYNKQLEDEKTNLANANETYQRQITGGFNVTPGSAPEVPKGGNLPRPVNAGKVPPPKPGKVVMMNRKTKQMGYVPADREMAYRANGYDKV